MAIEIKKGGIYTFTTINPGYLGSLFEQARCSAEAEYVIAKVIEPNLDAMQAAVLPYLPVTASQQHTNYKYFIFITQTGQKVVFAQEWINATSIKENLVQALSINIVGATLADLPQIRNVLGLSGWNIVNAIT